MNNRPKDVPTIFGEALEIAAPADREAYLDRVCGGDAGLRRQVDQLLDDHAQAGDFLELPATQAIPQFNGGIGSMIGPYKLREQLGEGGMGVVYVAEQERPVRRKVALKVIKPGMDSREVIARFEAERQALALMDHPNIARVLDAGTTQDTGRPYFVMELVRGIPITDYCDRCSLRPRERLKLFIQVGQAVQHAHQKGVIHRDLKPSNVLVTLHDGVPVPKVIDFGVAKAINQRLSEHTVYTRVSQMVGTPLYMSPEQAELSGLDVDTRSDVYSLGVLLYELLAGTTPFDKETFSKVGFDEMRRMIREDEPPRPSQRVSTLEAKARSTVSGKRGIDERNLTQELRGELDWIVMKALEKDRQQRYESASAFAADVQRYLDDEPVAACPPSAAYRLRKFARRNRTTLTTAIVVSTAMLIGTALSLWQAFEATSARKLADERRVLADQRLVLADERLASQKKAREEADEQRKQASANLKQALDAVDQMLMRVADQRLQNVPGAEPIQKELFQDALKFYEEFFQQTPNDPGLRQSTARAWARVSDLHSFFGDLTREQESRQESIRQWESLHAEYPNDPEIQVQLAENYEAFGCCDHWVRSKFASAEAAFTHAQSLWQDLANRYPGQCEYAWNLIGTEHHLADNHKCTGRHDDAERVFRHAIAVGRDLWTREPISGEKHPVLCKLLTTLVLFHRDVKRQSDEDQLLNAEALQRAEEIYARDPQAWAAIDALINAACQYGEGLLGTGNTADAEKSFHRAVEVRRQVPRTSPLRDFHRWRPSNRAELALADLLARDGRHSEALALYRAAGDLLRPSVLLAERFPVDSSRLAQADQGVLNSLKGLVKQGQLDQARSVYDELSQTAGSDALALTSRFLAARAWEAIGESERGQQILDQIVRQLDQQAAVDGDQKDRVQVGHVAFRFGDADFHRGNYERALPMLDLAIRINPGEWEALDHRGLIYLHRGENEKALVDFDESIRHGAAYGYLTIRFRARAHFRLGHYTPVMADLAEAVKRRPGDSRILNAIDPAEIAACPDASFRKTYIAWFEQAFAATKASPETHLHRAALHAELRQFEAVAADLDAILADNNPPVQILYKAALVALRSGDQARYLRACRLLTNCPQDGLTALDLGFVAWTLALVPNAIENYESAIAAARRAVALDPGAKTPLINLGAVLYRAGQFDEGVTNLTNSENAPANPNDANPKDANPNVTQLYARFFLAMSHHKLGHEAEARHWFDRAEAETIRILADGKTEGGEPVPWNHRLTLELLHAEATALLATTAGPGQAQ